jgi:hypothetical protein
MLLRPTLITESPLGISQDFRLDFRVGLIPGNNSLHPPYYFESYLDIQKGRACQMIAVRIVLSLSRQKFLVTFPLYNTQT